ncbi:FxsB family cyclophane-forming radical SAM/SPASM peptide maturase [Actinoplanes sp. N902-109]|uniref:FxsB family cyclophane-forming radical SAM/SPASM peptide maturase n=1 Tax=Actinoplanes sp. (strain N902-109) TaxID=649831 RepID=UPI00032953AC|nr:FxsB family cyclophane-forming radical SAM/SPASM peptide maturase [Actinoplanes sp. N902-109]AGL15883.1 Radical SAM domain-containing protein [Actinoplanes sp. N902-109]
MVAPFRQYVVKLHSRCNLSCDYCYVYQHVDQSWRDRPMVMSPATIDALAGAMAEHVAAHGVRRVHVVLHGGEPLLAGPGVLEQAVTRIRSALPAGTGAEVSLQTNGTLIDDRFIDVFRRHRIGVGISVDGGREATDRHRRFADGRPSFHLVERGIERLRAAAGERWTGLLCTVDLTNDPLQVYEDLLALRPPHIDFLLPLANWAHPPPGHGSGPTPYADWLIPIFDRWFSAPRRATGIRLFESIIGRMLGGSSGSEAVGLDSADAITVETDGSLEVTDALKTTAPGLGALGLSVHRNSLDEAMARPEVRAARRTLARLAPDCRKCPLAQVCGGGQYSHRFGPDGTFDHRSVYCADLQRLITHVHARLRAALETSPGA